MYYGLVFKEQKEVPVLSISEQVFGISSLVYDEYINRKTLMECLLEEVVDEEQRIRLEAQLEVLKEVSIKDIKDKIIKIFKKIAEFFKMLMRKIKEFFTKIKNKKPNVSKIINKFNNKNDFNDDYDDPDFFNDDFFKDEKESALKNFDKQIDEMSKILNDIVNSTDNHLKNWDTQSKEYDRLSSESKNKTEELRSLLHNIKYESATVLEDTNYYSHTGSKVADKTICAALFKTIAQHPMLIIENGNESDFNKLKSISDKVNDAANSEEIYIFTIIHDIHNEVIEFATDKRDFYEQLKSAKNNIQNIFANFDMITVVKLIDKTSDSLEKRIAEYNTISDSLTKSIDRINAIGFLKLADDKEELEIYALLARTINRLKDYISKQVIEYTKSCYSAKVLLDFLSNINIS